MARRTSPELLSWFASNLEIFQYSTGNQRGSIGAFSGGGLADGIAADA